MLGTLRGGAMKIGQLASFVDVDFLPPEFRAIYQERLGQLRDTAPTMSWEKVRGVLEREWEQPIESLLAEIEPDAVAAASIGQVHRGVLVDGRRVAIKVQYPEVADALVADLDMASVLIRLGKVLAPGLDPELVAAELRERVLEELDFELEAQQQRTFARAYRGHPFIHVPQVVTALSRRRVLVSEWVDGAALRRDPAPRSGSARPCRRDHGALLLRLDAACRDGSTPIRTRATICCSRTAGWRSWTSATRPRSAIARADAPGARGSDRRRPDGFTGTAAELGYVRDRAKIDRELLMAQALVVGDWYLRDRELPDRPRLRCRRSSRH